MPQTWMPGDEIAVEVAWGADLTADPDSWSWTDITDDVYQEPGVSITLGRGDEASTSQPASCSLQLRNESGDYSVGGQSSNWPNVRQGTPVRVRVDPDNTGLVIAFQGAAVGWTPAWDLTGTIPIVSLEAAGALRRIAQGKSPIMSSFARTLTSDSTVVAYWPCEEGKGAGGFIPAVGPYFMSWDTPPDLAAADDITGSAPLPILKGSEWIASVPGYTAATNNETTVQLLTQFPESGESNFAFLTVITTGTIAAIQLTYETGSGGKIGLYAYNAAGGLIDSVVNALDIDGGTHLTSIQWDEIGGVAVISGGTANFGYGQVAIAGTVGLVTLVDVNGGSPGLQEVAAGHLVVRKDMTDQADDLAAYVGHAGETATERIIRLCAENNELIDVIGTSTVTMGAQSIGTLLDLLLECEAADGGILLDGLGPGLTYISRTERENRTTDLTVDAGTGRQLAPAFAPVNDDQRIRNKALVTRKDAGTFSHEDVDGPLGTSYIGTYDTSLTANVEEDGQAQHYAEWLVHLGTQEGYRYPELTFDLRATPALGPGVLALTPSCRVDVDDIEDTLTQHPGSGLSLLVEGLAHNFTGATWTTTAKCSLYDPWNVAQLSLPTYAAQAPVAGAVAVSANSTASDSITPALPSHQPGDVLFCYATVRNSGTGTIVTPDGWRALVTNGNTVLLARLARENDTAPTIRATGGATNETLLAQCFAASGLERDLDQLVAASATTSNVSQGNITVPALTISENNCLVLIMGWKQDDWTSVATLSGQGFTELFDSPTTSGSDAGIVLDYRIDTTATSVITTSLVPTGGANAIGRSIVVALRRTSDELVTRLDTDDSELQAGFSAGATSISVTTNSGPLWTTTSTDMPYDLDIGGVKFTVTACSDGTSPQVMTISAASVARSAGAPVKLWKPPVLGR